MSDIKIREVIALALALALSLIGIFVTGSPVLSSLFIIILPLLIYRRFVHWVASKAEGAGRSYVGFMILAIFFPVIAAIIVLIFKQDPPENPQN